MDCLFCKIARKEISADIIYEDEEVLAFLDLFPQCEGQTLIIPKRHVDYFIKMNDQEYSDLQKKSKKIACILEKTFTPLRVCMHIEGLDVPHVHVKLYPILKFEDLRKKGVKASEEEFKKTKDKIISNFS